MSTLSTFIQHSFGIKHSNQKKKYIYRRNPNWKGLQIQRVNVSLLADDRILHTEKPKDTTKKLLGLINEYSKVIGYKIIYRNLSHFYTLTVNYRKDKLRKQSHLPLHKIEQNT